MQFIIKIYIVYALNFKNRFKLYRKVYYKLNLNI